MTSCKNCGVRIVKRKRGPTSKMCRVCQKRGNIQGLTNAKKSTLQAAEKIDEKTAIPRVPDPECTREELIRNAFALELGYPVPKPDSGWQLVAGEWVNTRVSGVIARSDAAHPTMWRLHYRDHGSDLLNLARARKIAVAWAESQSVLTTEIV